MINIQNIDDNECFKLCLGRYLHSKNHNLKIITKTDKNLSKRLNFKDIKLPVKIRNTHRVEKKNSITISVSTKPCIKKNTVKQNKLIYYQKEKNANGTMFLLKILIHLCMIIHYVVEENILSLLFTSFQYRRNIKMS